MANLNPNIGPERVQVFDVPLGTVQLPGVATSVTAFLIYTTKSGASVNTPTSVTSFDQFVSAFGDADEVAHDGYYAVQGFFDNGGTGNTAIIVNVASNTAAAFIGSATAGTGLRALDLIDIVGLVCIPGLPLSMSYLVDPATIDYSKVVRADFGSTLSTTFSLVSVPKEISLANTDASVTTATIQSILTNVLTVGVGDDLSTVTPGMIVKKAGVFKTVITASNNTLKTITVLSTSGLSALDAIAVHLPSAITYKDSVVNDPSREASWYFNNLIVLDQSALVLPGTLKTVSSVGHVAGVMARMDANLSIGGVSHAPAGIRYAGLAGISGLNLRLSERVDAAPLRLAFINRITSFPGSGNIIYGGYTAGGSTVTADEQLIQVMRSLQYIKGSLERGLRGFLWENFSPSTQDQIARAIESFMRNNIHLFPAGLPEVNQFRVVSVIPTQNELDQGLLRVRVQVKPNSAVRFIEIDLEFPLPTA